MALTPPPPPPPPPWIRHWDAICKRPMFLASLPPLYSPSLLPPLPPSCLPPSSLPSLPTPSSLPSLPTPSSLPSLPTPYSLPSFPTLSPPSLLPPYCLPPSLLPSLPPLLHSPSSISMHLKPLRRQVEGWEECEFLELEKRIPALYHIVCLIWANSTHYQMPARLVVLMQEVSNFMIEVVRTQILCILFAL